MLTWKRVKHKHLQESLVREVITFSHLNSVKPCNCYRNIRQVSLTSYGPDLVVEDKHLVMAAKLVHGFKCSPCVCRWVIALHTCQATHIEPTTCINVTPWRKAEKKKKFFLYFCTWGERVWIILCEKFSLLLTHKEIKWQQGSSTLSPYICLIVVLEFPSFRTFTNKPARKPGQTSCLFYEKANLSFPFP